eukprot:6488173-Amphidinium_carterae.1
MPPQGKCWSKSFGFGESKGLQFHCSPFKGINCAMGPMWLRCYGHPSSSPHKQQTPTPNPPNPR